MSDNRSALFNYASQVGPMYGVEDFSIFLYSIIRMHRPSLMLELGTGSGSCSLLSALAMSENGIGKVISVDNGSHWPKLRIRKELSEFHPEAAPSHCEFMNGLAKIFHVSDHVEYRNDSFPPFPDSEHSIDIIFSDYESHPAAIAALLGFYIPKMSESSSIFIDGASTYLPSFLFIERLIADLNSNKIPAAILKHTSDEDLNTWIRLVHTRKYTLIHLTEKKERDQNSTSWIKIEPIDHIPHPATKMR